MNETRKMNQIRKDKGYDLYFSGNGIDIGCGRDILDDRVFTNIRSVQPYDRPHGDANLMANIEDDTFDFVYSSHCLEHMVDPELALKNWIRICKPGGYVVVAVPHEIYYEKLVWPSYYNPDHKCSFRMEKTTNMPKSIFLEEFFPKFENVGLVSCELYLVNFDFTKFWQDQTLGDAICQIEFVLRKKHIPASK
jgi:SAM-dependent methyltransferase